MSSIVEAEATTVDALTYLPLQHQYGFLGKSVNGAPTRQQDLLNKW
jgi:hypothetical protein